MEEERRAEVAQLAEEQRKRDAAEAEKLAERERTRRVALQRSSNRGGKARSAVYLSQSTRLLFPRLGVRISALQRKVVWKKLDVSPMPLKLRLHPDVLRENRCSPRLWDWLHGTPLKLRCWLA